MASTCMKRLVEERERFPKDSPEYWVNFKDDNLRAFEAYIVAPEDSVYKHRLIKLKFEIPDNYPLVPPKVKFVQHTGDRIHPNLYTEGKVCLSILGTWPGDPWSYSMTIESVLITIRSLLDNKPYLHEPHQRDSPQFNDYVRYHAWRWLLLDYLERERDPEAVAFLRRFIHKNGSEMVIELERQKCVHGSVRTLTSPYNRKVTSAPQYNTLLASLKAHIARNTEHVPCDVSTQSQSLQRDLLKRKELHDTPEDSGPKQKRKQASPCVIDLTDDP